MVDLKPEFLQKALEVLGDGLLVLNPAGEVVYANPAASRILPLLKGILDRDSCPPREGAFEREVLDPRQGPRYLLARCHRFREGEGEFAILLLTDITDHRRKDRELQEAKERLAYMATHDPLTDLPNRRLFFDRLDHAIARAKRYGHKVALLFLDLDGFKALNDRFGHPFGDKVLKEVASRIRSCVRRSDTVARLGGDEFAVVLDGLRDERGALLVEKRIRKALAEPLMIDGEEVLLEISMGMGFYPLSGEDPEALLREADSAMYREKRRKKGYLKGKFLN